MIGDLLLTWMSEIGSGTVADFHDRAAWLARTDGLALGEGAPRWWLRDAAALGHCEVDWTHGKWSVTQPVLAQLPQADGLAVLCGARRPRLVRAIDERDIYEETRRRNSSHRDIPSPSTILIPYQSAHQLQHDAAAIGAAVGGCAAERISSLLRSTAPAAPSAPPAYSSLLERLTSVAPQRWRPASPRDPAPPRGLYREQVNGRWQHLVRCADSWLTTDLSSGIFAELARLGRTVMRWLPDGDDPKRTGTLLIDARIPLPPLHERALVLCSGFVPRFEAAFNELHYDNVPRAIADDVASTLGQSLQIGSRRKDQAHT